MKPGRRAGLGSPSKERKAAMRFFAFGAVFTILSVLSFRVSAADLASAPPVLAQPHYGVAPNVPAAPTQVIIVPGSAVPPEYNGALVPPPPNGATPYGIAPPVAPRVDAVPHVACPPIWRCGERGCSWQPGCALPPEQYPDRYGSQGPQVYSVPSPAPGYPRPYAYGSPGPQVYSSPSPAPGYPGRYGSVGPHVYSSPNNASPAPGHPGPYGSPDPRGYSGPDNASPAPGYRGPYGSPDPHVYSGPDNASPAPGYRGPYGSPDPHVYSGPDYASRAPGYPGPYGLTSPPVYSAPNASPAPEGYPGPYSSQAYPGRGPYPAD
jgi:hypothetical protein